MRIHPTAIVDASAEIDGGVEIGAYAIVERGCKLAAGVRLWPHAYLAEGTTLGERVQVHPFAVVGHVPQDLKFTGEPSYTIVGDDTIIREHAQIHRGTSPGSTTRVGRRCFLMSSTHIGHNCDVADNVTICTYTALGGHVSVGPRAFIGGGAVLHQFIRIGELAMIGGGSALSMDVLPFMLVRRIDIVLGVNVVGLRRAGYDAAQRTELRDCFRLIAQSNAPMPRIAELVAARVQTDAGRRLLEFLLAPSTRGVLINRGASAPDLEAVAGL